MVDSPDTISLDTTTPPETISLDTGPSDNYLLSPEQLTKRSVKFAYATAGTPAAVSEDDATTALQSGKESELRKGIAGTLNSKQASDRQDLIVKTAAQKQGPLTSEDMNNIDTVAGYNFPFKYPLDPNSILEVNYAKQYTGEFDKLAAKLPDTNFWNYGQMVARNDLEAAQIFGDVTIAQHQFLSTISEDAQAKIEAQSTIGYGIDFGKSNFPIMNPYYELKLRGNVPGVGYTDGGLLGENLEAQRIKLHQLPFDQFTQTVTNIYNHLSADNPQIALAWVSAMMGQSSSDRLLNNINTIGHAFDVPIVFSIGKTIFSGPALQAELRNAVKTALKQQTPGATVADIKSSVGNVKEAALANATEDLVGKVSGTINPTEEGLNTLPANFNIMKNEIDIAPNLSQAQRTILKDETDGSIVRALQTLIKTLRPTRVDLENISGNTLYKVQKTLVDRYPRDNDAILGLTNPIHDPISQSYYSKMWWGKNGGDLFDNYHEAADSARAKGFTVTYDTDHLAELQSRADTLKAEIKAGPDMHADAGELTYHYSLPDTLKSIETKIAEVSKPGGATIQQQGLKFYIEKIEHYRESDRAIINLVANPANPLAVSPDSWTKFVPYLNHARTAEDTFSAEARAQRKVAIYPQATFLAMVKEEGKILQDFFRGAVRNDPVTGELNPFYKRGVPGVRGFMNKERTKNFLEVLDHSQNQARDPETKIPGYWYTPTELNDFYLRKWERPASFEETQAYEAVKRWDQLQRVFTQTMEYRGQAIRGNLNHTLIFKNADGTIGKSPEFVGALKSSFPTGRGNLLVMGDDIKGSSVHDLDRPRPKEKKTWTEMVKSGSHKLIAVDLPDSMPFKDLGIAKNGDALIHYVLAPNSESRDLRWDSVPNRGGGRHVYDYSLYLKTAKMKYDFVDGQHKSYYLGDQTIAPIAYRGVGEDVAKKYNVVRKLIKENKDVEAKASYIHNGLEGALEPWQDFRKKFNRWKDEDGKWHDALYNAEEDAHVVPRNTSIADMGKGYLENNYNQFGKGKFKDSWRDATREGNPARNFQVRFTGERDAENFQSIDNIGTVKKPIYQRSPAQKVDPLSMLNRGMNSTINSLFMDDYKAYAVTSWLKEAVPNLKATENDVWSSPYAAFKTITKDSFESGFLKDKPEEVGKLLANHFKINQLVGTPTTVDTYIHSVSQKIADAAYNTLGPNKASLITPTWLIHKLSDPAAFLRSVTFNAYLGLFSVPQMLVQSMTYVNMFAISPKYATQGMVGVYFHYLSRFNTNPEILKTLDRMASKMGYKPGELLEAMREFKDSGFGHVGQEQGLLSNMPNVNIIKKGMESFLEAGRKPFQWGEMNSRIGAWYVAMKEFRDLHPTGKMSNLDRASVLDRADFYYGNMSVASHSAINSGLLSLPTQFYMYTARLAEMFWSGTRLGGTLAERNLARARLIAVNGAMFGLPMALGVTGLPISDWLREHILDNGYFGLTPPYVVGKNFAESVLHEGVLAGLGNLATGHWWNVGPREGLGGLTPFKDTLSQDAKFWNVLGGASASLTMNTFNNGVYPLLHEIYHGNFANTKLEDLVDIFKEVQSVNSGWAWWVAMNTGKWINKHSDIISDTSKTNASWMFLSGLRDTSISDVWHKEATIKARDEVQKYALKQFAEQLNRAMLAEVANDPQQAQQFKQKAIAWLPATDFPPEKLGQALVRAFKGAENLIDRVDMKFYYGDSGIRPDRKETLRKAFEYVLQNKGK